MTWRSLGQRLLQLRKSRLFRWTISALFLLLFGGFLYYRFTGDWQTLVQPHFAIDPVSVLAGGALCGVNFVLFLVVWHSIVVALGGSRDWRVNVLVYCYTYLARLLPTPLPFFAGRLYYSERIGLTGRRSMYATGLELGLHVLAGICFYSLLELVRFQRWIYAAVLAAGMIVAWKSGLMKRLELAPSVSWRGMPGWLACYFVTWIIAGPYLQAAVRAFTPFSIDIWSAWRVYALAGVAGYAGFLLMGGTGLLRDLSLSSLLTAYFLPGDLLVIAVGSRLILLASTVICAFLAIVVVRFLLRDAQPQVERTTRDG